MAETDNTTQGDVKLTQDWKREIRRADCISQANSENSCFAAGADKAISKLRELEHKFDIEPLDHSVEQSLNYEKDSSRQFVESLNLSINDEEKGLLTGIVEYIAFTMNTSPPKLNVWRPLSAMSETDFKDEVERLTVR